MSARRLASLLVALFAVLWMLSLGAPSAAAPGDNQPVPISGGIDVPPLIHVFAPGPTSTGLMGLDVEPSTITNFRGFSAYAVFKGTTVDSHGASYDAVLDMRVFSGDYISSNGKHHHGTFGFI